jgi:NADH-quinone oxidoreductase subunit C
MDPVDIKQRLVTMIPDGIEEVEVVKPYRLKIRIRPELIIPVCTRLKELNFEHCSMISAVDWQDQGFECVYHLRSYKNNLYVEIKVKLPRDSPRIDSIADMYGGADWHEREAYDLMGITFDGHPNLKRILLPDDWIGHPLRKDYKESGP